MTAVNSRGELPLLALACGEGCDPDEFREACLRRWLGA